MVFWAFFPDGLTFFLLLSKPVNHAGPDDERYGERRHDGTTRSEGRVLKNVQNAELFTKRHK